MRAREDVPFWKSCLCCPTFIKNVPNARYCELDRLAARRQTEIATNERKKTIQRSARLEKQEAKARKKKILVTEEQQCEINKAVDSKHRLHFSSARYTPGTPEFEKIAAQYR